MFRKKKLSVSKIAIKGNAEASVIISRIPFEFLDSVRICIFYRGDSAWKIVLKKTYLKFNVERVRL